MHRGNDVKPSQNPFAKMMPLIDALMNALELEIKDLDGIAISAGPGSFTGVRIGMATAKALAHASGLPLIQYLH